MKAYVRAMRAGLAVPERPDSIRWTPISHFLERYHAQHGTQLEVMEQLFQALFQQFPELDMLVNSNNSQQQPEISSPPIHTVIQTDIKHIAVPTTEKWGVEKEPDFSNPFLSTTPQPAIKDIAVPMPDEWEDEKGPVFSGPFFRTVSQPGIRDIAGPMAEEWEAEQEPVFSGPFFSTTSRRMQRFAVPSRKQRTEKRLGRGTVLTEVEPTTISWLWPDRIALGNFTLLEGDPGTGKSCITCDLIARITRGRAMPDDTPALPGSVIIIAPEDGMGDTVRPRLERAGADCSKVISLTNVKVLDPQTGGTTDQPFIYPDDLPALEAEIQRHGVILLVIDPIMALLGGKDVYKDNQVRKLLKPLKDLVERHKIACLLIRHLTKSGGDHTLYRGGGSIAMIAMARSALLVVRDPSDEDRCILGHTKSNNSKQTPSLLFRITSDKDNGGSDPHPYIAWEGISDLSNRDLLAPPTYKSGIRRQEILRVLREHYPEAMSAPDLEEALPEMNISALRMTLKRMVEGGQIEKSARGLYIALPASQHIPTMPQSNITQKTVL
ncbi:MAG: AAA family ATPase [Chloroflexi bacterium]|nr:AAA family ATPase [Chloroflexota bacterium]